MSWQKEAYKRIFYSSESLRVGQKLKCPSYSTVLSPHWGEISFLSFRFKGIIRNNHAINNSTAIFIYMISNIAHLLPPVKQNYWQS